MNNSNKPAAVFVPLTSIKPLYSSSRGRKKTIIFEAEVNALKQVNEPNTIDEMVAEARLEYVTGKTKTFASTAALMKELRS